MSLREMINYKGGSSLTFDNLGKAMDNVENEEDLKELAELFREYANTTIRFALGEGEAKRICQKTEAALRPADAWLSAYIDSKKYKESIFEKKKAAFVEVFKEIYFDLEAIEKRNSES